MRNAGQPGVVGYALSAVDIALWDLKARLLGLPLVGCWARSATRARLRQRRLHHLRRRPDCATSSPLGQARAFRGSRSRSASPGPRREPRPAPDQARAGGRSATTSSCSSTPTAPTPRSRPCRVDATHVDDRAGDLVRGAGLLRRPRRACAGPRAASRGRDGRRVRLRRSPTVQPDVRRAGGGLPPGRRHPLRRLHRVAARPRPSPPGHRLEVSGHCAPHLHRARRRPPCPACATWSGSTTTSGSRSCCSTGCAGRSPAPWSDRGAGPGQGLALRRPEAESYRVA